MRGSFLWRNRVVLTGGLMLLLALHLISSGVTAEGRSGRPVLVLMEVLRPFQAFESNLAENFHGFFSDYIDLVDVREENDRLKRKLAQVQSERTRLVELEVENHHLSDLLELREALATSGVAARVIGGDATGLAHTLVLSQGSSMGLHPEMAVISTDGVVGKLITVSPNASRALLIDDHNSGLDALDQRSRARGIVTGIAADGLIMKYVDRTGDVKPGDAVITSGMDGIFPGGLLVGQVVQVSQEGPGLFLNIAIKPAVDFSKLEELLVLTERPPLVAANSRATP
ncbi:MAG TPA: rod shape-determining protein MreC [Candidatus Binataceae bacterium]|nr:rod shape-determining protein MreC [Candidatus Binataceae bacterium]